VWLMSGVQANHLEGFRAVMARVKEEFNAGGVATEDGEIDPLGFQARPRGIAPAWQGSEGTWVHGGKTIVKL
jgi:hypothetical protein